VTRAEARRERRKVERREAILLAAARVFEDKGASAVTMDDVAEAADVSKGTLYLYFSSKDDLFLALTHHPLDAVLERFEALVDSDEDGLSLLRSLLVAHHEVVHTHASRMRIALGSMCSGFEVDPDTPSLRDYSERVQRLREAYMGAIERGQADGSIRADLDPEQAGLALWAGNFGASFIRMNSDRFRVHAEAGRPLPPFERVHAAFMSLFLRSIASSPESVEASS